MLDTMEDRPPIITVKDSPSPSTGEVTPQLESTKPQMFRFLSNIFETIVPRDHTGSGFDEWPAFLERADGGLEIGKALRTVVSILQYLRENSPAIIAPATKVLADGSRYGKLAMVVSEVLQEGEHWLIRAQSRGDYLSEMRRCWTSTLIFLPQMKLSMIGLRMLCV